MEECSHENYDRSYGGGDGGGGRIVVESGDWIVVVVVVVVVGLSPRLRWRKLENLGDSSSAIAAAPPPPLRCGRSRLRPGRPPTVVPPPARERPRRQTLRPRPRPRPHQLRPAGGRKSTLSNVPTVPWLTVSSISSSVSSSSSSLELSERTPPSLDDDSRRSMILP